MTQKTNKYIFLHLKVTKKTVDLLKFRVILQKYNILFLNASNCVNQL